MREVARGDKPYLRKSTDRKAQIRVSAKLNERLPDLCFAFCRFSQVRVYHPEPPHAQSLFLFPIVFGINLIHFFDGKNINWDWAGFDQLSWVFDHLSRGSCRLKEGEQGGQKLFWQWKVWTRCEFQRHNGDLSVKGETGSVKGETKSANFWQEKV